MPADTIEVFSDLERPPLAGPRGGPLFPADPRWRVTVVAATGSTNADLAAAVRSGAATAGQVLVAEEQHAGRGRQGRSWVSPPRAGLTFSAVLATAPSPWVPLLAGVAVARAVRDAGVPATLKWPNDLQVHGRKLAGLLAEVAAPGLVVVGIGLNVSTRRAELPPGATSLALEGAAVTDRKTVLHAILRALGADPPPGPADYRELCDTLGREVSLALPTGASAVGTATDLDGDGRLVVAGTAYSAGDVVHLRSVPTDGGKRGG